MKLPTRTRRLVALFTALAALGTTVSGVGCKKKDEDEETDEDSDKDEKEEPKKEEPPSETAKPTADATATGTASAAEPADAGAAEAEAPADAGAAVEDAGTATGEVAQYPNMVKQSGTVQLLRSFDVFQAADRSSKKLTGLAKGTLVDLKYQYGNWMMINYPSGPAQLSPGWVELNPNDNRVQKVDKPVPTTTVPPPPPPSASAPPTPSQPPPASSREKPPTTLPKTKIKFPIKKK